MWRRNEKSPFPRTFNGRSYRIRTCGLLLPRQARYQAALNSEVFDHGAGEGTRTPTVARQILSLVRLPIPPHPHGLKSRHQVAWD